MSADFPILSLTIWLPILGGLWIIFAGRRVHADAVRNDALLVSVATFLVSLLLWQGFDNATADMQFVEQAAWIPAFGIEYLVGIDGIALPLVLLTTFITPLVVLASWVVIKDRPSLYMGAFLLLEGMMIG
ncbi:MAG: NADH-quinone oxidoreductase subunit M, partial [Gammaproteobacteria bacterium]